MLGARVGQRAEDHALVAGDGEDEGAAEILPKLTALSRRSARSRAREKPGRAAASSRARIVMTSTISIMVHPWCFLMGRVLGGTAA